MAASSRTRGENWGLRERRWPVGWRRAGSHADSLRLPLRSLIFAPATTNRRRDDASERSVALVSRDSSRGASGIPIAQGDAHGDPPMNQSLFARTRSRVTEALNRLVPW